MTMNKIQLLDTALCSQIAAGEVLERASSAVKELVENSLDAGASRIDVEIQEGGRKLIRVTDNGCGMNEEDARSSILRHATSKIRTVHDLESIKSLGFRGEALASMAAVSRMQILTQETHSDLGTKVEIQGAQILSQSPIATGRGTQISIQDLFFNTPARLKFLKTTATENRRVYEVLEQMALSHPSVHFTLSVDDKIKLDAAPNDSLRQRALAVLGRNLYERLYPLNPFNLGPLSLSGLFSSPDFSVGDRGRIYTFVNNRAVKDKTITSAIIGAYKEFLHGKMPCVIINISIPHDLVDVNVHPTKTELRFQDQDLVFRSVYRSLREALSLAPWVSKPSTDFPSAPALSNAPVPAFSQLPAHNFLSPEQLSPTSPHPMRESAPSPLADFHPPLEPPFDFDTGPTPIIAAKQSAIFNESTETAYFSSLQYLGQVSNTYLVATDHDKLVLIDQHAAHERINFELLKATAQERHTPEIQNLLFPIIIDLDARLAQVLEEFHNFFDELGLQLDALSDTSFALKAVPRFLLGYDYDAMLRAALTDLASAGHSTQFQDLLDDLLATMACHGSVRAGHPLSRTEVLELFRQMDACLFKSNCPHGRPVHFIMSAEEIEKRFQRR